MEPIEKEAWDKLLALAQAGDRQAQWEAGYYHEHGGANRAGLVVVERNRAEAIRWYTQSAESGDAAAQCALSNLFSTPEGGERDFKQAIFWARKAIAQGNASAAYNLATIYRDLNRPKRAFHWYKRAAEMGDGDALLQIGLCRMFGFGTAQDLAAAAKCFEAVFSDNSARSCQRSKEDALFWAGVLQLLRKGAAGRSLSRARAMLESANADDDHRQANELLNLIGKTAYLAD